MNRTAKRFSSLLNLVEPSAISGLDAKSIEDYASVWKDQWQHGNTVLNGLFSSEEDLEVAINDLVVNLREQKLVFQSNELLSFLEDEKIESGLAADIDSISNKLTNPWLKELVQETYINAFVDKSFERGVKNIQFIKSSKNSFGHLPLNVQDKIESLTKRNIKRHLDLFAEAIEANDKDRCHYYVTGHIKNAFLSLPFESQGLIEIYAKRCELLVRKNLPRSLNSELGNEEQGTFAKAALLAGEILKDPELKKIGYKNSIRKDERKKRSRKLIVSMVSWIAIIGVMGYGIYKVVPIIRSETKTYDEKYEEYVQESNDFYRNRKLSVEAIEQRKTTEIVESFQYGERENVPLFYTYIKTNKFFDINEVDNELYKLKNSINTEGIETNKIFALVHFFIHDKENPYRSVLTEYSNVQRDIKYKQILKTRVADKINVNSWDTDSYRVSIEVKDDHLNGVIELSVFDLHFYPREEMVKLYSYTPMPTLTDSLSMIEYNNLTMNDVQDSSIEVMAMVRLMDQLLEGVAMRYRIPHYVDEVQYDVNAPSITPMYNWELTTSDDLAFIRIRSDGAKGYYLVNRESGRIIQSKAGYKTNEGINKSYFIHFENLDN